MAGGVSGRPPLLDGGNTLLPPRALILRYLAALLVLSALTLVTLTALGWMTSELPRRRPVQEFTAASDAASIERGRSIATAACSCHGNAEGALSGGSRPMLEGAFGTLWAPNLTPGGPAARYTDAELARAIREGLDPRGRPLALMPTHLFRDMSDRDLAATVGFLRAQPAVERSVPPRRLGPLHYLLVSTRVVPSPVLAPLQGPVPGPLPHPEPGYGRYLSRIVRCVECHGEEMKGGRRGLFRAPPGPDLLLPAHGGSYDEFARAVREGVGADGRRLEPHRIPWTFYALLGDNELHAIYEALRVP